MFWSEGIIKRWWKIFLLVPLSQFLEVIPRDDKTKNPTVILDKIRNFLIALIYVLSGTSGSLWPIWTQDLTNFQASLFNLTCWVFTGNADNSTNAMPPEMDERLTKKTNSSVKNAQIPDTSHGCFDILAWTVCSDIMLADMLSTLRVSLQIDGSPHAQLAGMHVSMDVSRRKRHQGLQKNVSDLHTITCHWCCCMTCGRLVRVRLWCQCGSWLRVLSAAPYRFPFMLRITCFQSCSR